MLTKANGLGPQSLHQPENAQSKHSASPSSSSLTQSSNFLFVCTLPCNTLHGDSYHHRPPNHCHQVSFSCWSHPSPPRRIRTLLTNYDRWSEVPKCVEVPTMRDNFCRRSPPKYHLRLTSPSWSQIQAPFRQSPFKSPKNLNPRFQPSSTTIMKFRQTHTKIHTPSYDSNGTSGVDRFDLDWERLIFKLQGQTFPLTVISKLLARFLTKTRAVNF